MTETEPEEDVGPGPLPQPHHPRYPQLVQDRHQTEPELSQTGEGEVPREILALHLLAGKGDVEEDGSVPDLLHVVAGDPGDQAGIVTANIVDSEENRLVNIHAKANSVCFLKIRNNKNNNWFVKYFL